MKKTVNKWQYHFLEESLESALTKNTITSTQKKDILNQYEVKDRLDFIQVVVTIGAILMGLGAILFVSSNWEVIPNLVKVFILLITMGCSLYASYLMKSRSLNVSKALLYLAVLIFGASLFLIDIAYQFNIEAYTINFVWALAAILLSAIHKDFLLFIFAHVLAIIFIVVGFEEFIFIQSILLLSVLFIGNAYFGFKRLVTFGSLVVLQVFILYGLTYIDLASLYISLIFLIEGALLYYTKHQLNFEVFQFIGLSVMGIAAFSLTFPGIYEDIFETMNGSWISLPFTLVFSGYLLTLINEKKITPLIILSIFIIRFYFDTFYDTLPRSFFFIIGGALILLMGIFIEKRRRVFDEKA